MHASPFTKPIYIFFLVLPAGISVGFATVTLPFLLTTHGFSVAATGAIVSVGVSANLWRFLWGPVADLTLSLRKWFWIGVTACTASLLLLSIIPYTTNATTMLTSVVFVSQIASTFIMLPVGGFMATRIEEHQKGMAAGWFQAGNLGGVGLGGGVGLWVANHFSVTIAGLVLCVGCIVSALVVQLIQDVKQYKGQSIVDEVKLMGKSIAIMISIPVALFVIILICFPIGSGAAANVWSSIAVDWKVDADTVALVTGVISGLISAVGCVVGGWFADKYGVWWAYLGSGMVCAIVGIGMATLPYHPWVYIGGVLAYGFALGLMNAAFSAILLYAIGKKMASTKYSLLSSLGNLPVVYMTVIDSTAHDKWGSKAMLIIEGIIAILFILLSVIILKIMSNKKLVLETVPDQKDVLSAA